MIDDLGNTRAGRRAVSLPGPLTVAVLPFTPFASQLAHDAHANGKQVLVHLPMQSMRGHSLGPHGLSIGLTRSEFQRRVRDALRSVPFARGVNNHMGSRLTADPEPMRWLMSILSEQPDWLFLDSRTTHLTVAAETARQSGVAVVSRDVFLDNDRRPREIQRRLRQALSLARRRGHAVAIGHPHAETLGVLEQELPEIRRQGVRLVPISELARRHPDIRLLYTRYSPSGGHAAMIR